jgi:hypothetical protein
LWFVATLFEKDAEEGCGFVLQDSGGVGVGVVQAGVGREVVESARGACFGVWGGIYEAAYAGGVQGTGAHGARLEGSVEGTVGEAPATELLGSAAEGEELGVGGRVSGSFALVVGGRDDFLSPGDHGADGDLALFGGLRGFFEGAAHHCEVSGGRFVVVFWFKFFGHGADNSNASTNVGADAARCKRWVITALACVSRMRDGRILFWRNRDLEPEEQT